ncbi:4-carboxymuconolactone decarboxylase [Breoghania corrubedonensis]|uniref:4-carboxymuconolactone decarboxylase n=1 Tax=Breoghania corrubedonensis TaxID=665038 RepID=A0A2T5UW78_9HYPH|nr:4-carboxymuconolactone decarboxylase [Breoghania corrubedonensis]PTW55758.1 4-carboxymuconolactone decarboxylase [Breoghania corrubedonensis]
MDEGERHELGMKTRRSVLGDAHVDRAEANKTAFTSDFQDLITRYAWGEIWTRQRFDHKTRRLLVLSMMVALGRWEEFVMHVRAALFEGELEPEDIKEVLLQCAIYCGVPAANTAFKEAADAVAEYEKASA